MKFKVKEDQESNACFERRATAVQLYSSVFTIYVLSSRAQK